MKELLALLEETQFEDTFYKALTDGRKYATIPLNFESAELPPEAEELYPESKTQWEKEANANGEEIIYLNQLENCDIIVFSLTSHKVGYIPALKLESDYHC